MSKLSLKQRSMEQVLTPSPLSVGATPVAARRQGEGLLSLSLEGEGWGEGEYLVDDHILTNRVTTTYLGTSRVRLSAGGRSFEADERTELDRPGAGFCPLELVASALGA